jgi:hypothetical protein
LRRYAFELRRYAFELRRYALTLMLDLASFAVCEPLACKLCDTLPMYFCNAVVADRAVVAPLPGADAAAAVVPAVVLAAALALDAVAAGVAEVVCTPTVCCSDCNRLLNRFCWVAAGTGAVMESLMASSVDSTAEPFLWPCAWDLPIESAAGAELKLAIADIRNFLALWRYAVTSARKSVKGFERQQFAADRRKRPSLAARAAAIAQLLAYIVQISHRVALLRPETLLRATPTIALPVFKAGSVPSATRLL